MARREARPARHDEPRREGGKPSGLLTGLVIGLVIGLIAAAGLAWYLSSRTPEFKPTQQAPESPPPVPVETHSEPTAKPAAPAVRPPPAAAAEAEAEVKPKPEAPADPVQVARPAAPIQTARPAPVGQPSARVPLTFYGILPGEKPAKPVEPPKSRELWWLQVAALKNPGDADKLRARLALLGLDVATQKVESAGQTLFRVRVGPYQRDEDAFADLDTLAAHNFEPRLLKEPVKGVLP